MNETSIDQLLKLTVPAVGGGRPPAANRENSDPFPEHLREAKGAAKRDDKPTASTDDPQRSVSSAESAERGSEDHAHDPDAPTSTDTVETDEPSGGESDIVDETDVDKLEESNSQIDASEAGESITLVNAQQILTQPPIAHHNVAGEDGGPVLESSAEPAAAPSDSSSAVQTSSATDAAAVGKAATGPIPLDQVAVDDAATTPAAALVDVEEQATQESTESVTRSEEQPVEVEESTASKGDGRSAGREQNLPLPDGSPSDAAGDAAAADQLATQTREALAAGVAVTQPISPAQLDTAARQERAPDARRAVNAEAPAGQPVPIDGSPDQLSESVANAHEVDAALSQDSPPPAHATESGRSEGLLTALDRFHRNGVHGNRGQASTSGTDGPRVDPARFVSRVARAFHAASERGGNLQLRLSPPELGSLQLELSVKDGALTATIETQTSSARSALLDNLPALRERLAEQGIRVEKFDVDVRRDGSGQQQGFDTGQQSETPQRDTHRRPVPQPAAVAQPSAEEAPSESTAGDNALINLVI